MYDYYDYASIFPLGKLSLRTIKKGFRILDDILLELSKSKCSEKLLLTLSNRYYTTIPHVVISLIDSYERINEEKELLSHMLTV